MNSKAVIDLKDWYSLFAVWEFSDRRWRLVKLTRLKEAITLCNQPKRLVFPTDINPNTVRDKRTKLKVDNRCISQDLLLNTSGFEV